MRLKIKLLGGCLMLIALLFPIGQANDNEEQSLANSDLRLWREVGKIYSLRENIFRLYGLLKANPRPKLVADPGELLKPNLVEWPATVQIWKRLASVHCTSTVVGEHSLLTSAHCVTNVDSAGKLTLHPVYAVLTLDGINWRPRKLNCEPMDGYPKRTKDLALCRLDDTAGITSFEELRVKFENITPDQQIAGIGSKITLLGYGCTHESKGGTLYQSKPIDIEGVEKEANKVVIIVTGDNVVLCSGDSGGAAYIFSDGGLRQIIGVNKYVCPLGAPRCGGVRSEVVATFQDDFIQFAKTWSTNENTQVCGISVDRLGCR